MSTRRIPIGGRPANAHGAERWINHGKRDASGIAKTDLYTARLTIDVTPELRARIKLLAFQRGVTVAELLRALLEREYREVSPSS